MVITKEQKQKAKEVTGKNFSLKFEEYLKQNNVKNRNNLPYSTSHIRWYFLRETNGSNPLDEHFINFWEIQTQKKTNKEKRLKSLKQKSEELLNY